MQTNPGDYTIEINGPHISVSITPRNAQDFALVDQALLIVRDDLFSGALTITPDDDHATD